MEAHQIVRYAAERATLLADRVVVLDSLLLLLAPILSTPDNCFSRNIAGAELGILRFAPALSPAPASPRITPSRCLTLARNSMFSRLRATSSLDLASM